MLFLAMAAFFSPHFVWTPPNPAMGPVTDARGNVYFSSTDLAHGARSMTKLDPDGNLVYDVNPVPSGMLDDQNGPYAADSAGNLYVVSVALDAASNENCKLIKLDPAGYVLYTLAMPLPVCYNDNHSQYSAMAIGADGSVYLTGNAYPYFSGSSSPNLPTTPGALVTAQAAAPHQLNAFAMRVNPQGTGLTYSTFLDPASPSSQPPATTGLAMAVDSQGQAYILGITSDAKFPASPGAYIASCNCSSTAPAIFLMRLSADGSRMSYSTFLKAEPFNGTDGFAANPLPPALSLSLDSGQQATVVQAQAIVGSSPYPADTPQGIRVTILNASGTAAASDNAATFLTRGQTWVAPDGQGNVLLAGNYAAGSLSTSPGAFANGSSFAAILLPEDGSLLYATRLPFGAAGPIISDQNGGFVVAGTSLIRMAPAAAGPPKLLGVANSAGGGVSPGLAPGELVSLYGTGLGPSTGVAAQFDPGSGSLPYTLAGTSVTFNGIRAPLLYAGNQQVNAIVPFGIQGGTVYAQVTANNISANPAALPQANLDPQIFQSYDGGSFNGFTPNSLVVNQDGTINSAKNPATFGQAITIFVSGAGLFAPPETDGLRGGLGPVPVAPVTAVLEFSESGGNCCSRAVPQVLYAGSAPTLAAGMLQVNLLLPAASTPIALEEVGLLVDIGKQGGVVPVDRSAAGAFWVASGK